MMEMCLVGKKFMRKFLYLPQMASLVHLDAGTIPEKRKRTVWSVLEEDAPRNGEYAKLII